VRIHRVPRNPTQKERNLNILLVRTAEPSSAVFEEHRLLQSVQRTPQPRDGYV
jgi:hypothetical protein